MRIEKKVLNDALRILGKMVCQTSPAEVFRGVRFVGTPGDVLAMATDGEEQVSLRIDAEVEGTEDFVVEYRALREMVRTAKGSRIELKHRKQFPPMRQLSNCRWSSRNFWLLPLQSSIGMNREQCYGVSISQKTASL